MNAQPLISTRFQETVELMSYIPSQTVKEPRHLDILEGQAPDDMQLVDSGRGGGRRVSVGQVRLSQQS